MFYGIKVYLKKRTIKIKSQMILYLICILCSLPLCYGEFSQNINNGDYIINTSKCRIPNIPPFSPSLIFIRNETVKCTVFEPLLSYTTVINNVATLHINKDAVRKYFGHSDNIRCCYSYVLRNGSELYPDEGTAMTFCREFVNEVKLQMDLVRIACSLRREFSNEGFPIETVYENVHQVITVKDNIKEKATKLKEQTNKKPISVLMVVIDSVSRLNFIRTMPYTKQFVTNNNFYEFIGYNKVDDNTFPNAMAFLTGLNLFDSQDMCKPTETYGLDNCPLIWYTYRNLGYATAYGEDWSQIATFNYFKKGFKNPPTDYYLKPYMDTLTYFRPIYQDTMPFCAGPESQGDRILNVAFDFANTLKDLPTFGVFWMNTFSHNEISAPMSMDRKVRIFFENLKTSRVLDESIIILLSDHGIRFGEINETPRGFYEVRLPMHFISLPQWFKEQYPVETKNMDENSRKLTSNYDLYMTLQHILKLSGTNYTVRPSKACPQCRSLFEKIPENRSCFEAGIPSKWCTCNVNTDNIFNINDTNFR